MNKTPAPGDKPYINLTVKNIEENEIQDADTHTPIASANFNPNQGLKVNNTSPNVALKKSKRGTTANLGNNGRLSVTFTEDQGGKVICRVTFLNRTYKGVVEGLTETDLRDLQGTITKIRPVIQGALDQVAASLAGLTEAEAKKVKLEEFSSEGVRLSGYRDTKPIQVTQSPIELQKTYTTYKPLPGVQASRTYYDAFLQAVEEGATKSIAHQIRQVRTSLAALPPVQNAPSTKKQERNVDELIADVTSATNLDGYKQALRELKNKISELSIQKRTEAVVKADTDLKGSIPEFLTSAGVSEDLYNSTMTSFLLSSLETTERKDIQTQLNYQAPKEPDQTTQKSDHEYYKMMQQLESEKSQSKKKND